VDTILAALNQAALYELATGNEVEVVVVSNKLYRKILNMGIIELYKLGPTYAVYAN